MLLNDGIVDIEKPDRPCLLTFDVDEFYFYIYQSFLIYKIHINNKWCFIRFLILTKLQYSSVFRDMTT